ncbi:hypothetical protein, partial [Neisseria sicca]|uniref:hypothetical protein n=1 Tax=Neisseria sicca TaxID=490 RepID=UPI001C992127
KRWAATFLFGWGIFIPDSSARRRESRFIRAETVKEKSFLIVEINSVVYTFGFCLKTRLSSYPALSRMSIDTGNPLCS